MRGEQSVGVQSDFPVAQQPQPSVGRFRGRFVRGSSSRHTLPQVHRRAPAAGTAAHR